MKIVINNCHGGFDLSEEAIDRYTEVCGILRGIKFYKHYDTEWKFNSYYTVPYDEFLRVLQEDKREGNYKSSNALCWSPREISRNDSILVQVVEVLGVRANGRHSELKIVEIPDDVEWIIQEYDGCEWVAEKHRTWS
jgi:hypothetical protein